MAGLTAAHELAERGFRVCVVDRNRVLGGKARSFPVPRTGRNGRNGLPSEHSWRSIFGFYNQLPDTLGRIPVPGGTVRDRLVPSEVYLSRAGGRADFFFPRIDDLPGVLDPARLVPELAFLLQTGSRLPATELAHFVRQLAIFLTSCDARRDRQWDDMTWAQYAGGGTRSPEYRAFTNSVPKAVALRPDRASARSVAQYWEFVIHAITGRNVQPDLPVDGVLNGPTNDVWIKPWIRLLRSLGVRFETQKVEKLVTRKGRVDHALLRDGKGRIRRLDADHFVCALPAQVARRMWTKSLRRADPRLEAMDELQTVWANGVQFFLREQVPLGGGHVVCVDSPWAVSGVTNAQFWARPFAATYGDGKVKDVLSMAIAEYDQPGILTGKTARRCTSKEIAREVWAQMKAHVEDTGQVHLPDSLLHSYAIDPALKPVTRRRSRAKNEEPLFANTAGSWADRPTAVTKIPNLFLAGDYVRTSNIDAATMECANEAGRAAANGVLEASGSTAAPAAIRGRFRPPEFAPLIELDAQRHRRGEPHLLA